MKKVGILTFHFADNYGAVLQSYALRKKINSFKDVQADIINYIPASFQYAKQWNSISQKIKWSYKRKSFDQFLKKKCGVCSDVISIVEDGEYDYYCVGSDQIWNTDIIFEEYFLPHVNKKIKKISYAASLGYSVNGYRINKKILKKYVPEFENVSVRENEHVKFIKDVTGKESISVLDPTLLLDASDYLEILPKEDLTEGEFLFFFWIQLNDSPIYGVELINRLSRRYEMPIVHSIYNAPQNLFNIDGGCMFYEGIENFLWYLKNAKCIVTNSYHGALFSIIFKKDFFVYPVETMRSRIDTLKEKLNIHSRVVDPYVLDADIEKKVNYEEVYNNLKIHKEISLNYLKQALDLSEE